MEFIETLLSGWENWDAGQWSLAVAILMALLYVLEKFLHIFSRLWRAVRPKPPKPSPVFTVPDPSAPPPEPPAPALPSRIGEMRLDRPVRGREEELQELRDGLLNQGRAEIMNAGAVVQGHGGIGKTTLARYYIQTYGNEYGGIFWSVAENEGALARSLLSLAPKLDLRLGNIPDLEAAKAILATTAEDSRKWLFVYDNVDSYDAIKGLLPQGAHLIVTTRSSAGWDGFATLATDVLGFATEDSAAVRLLMEAAGRDDDAAGARGLAEALGGLPLALVVAGSLIKSEGFAFADYQNRIAEVIATARANADYPDSVVRAVKLSYDRLPEDARRVADILAWWAPEKLAQNLLTVAPDGEHWESRRQDLSEDDIALVSDPARVRTAFQALVDPSLLTREGTADGDHAMHRMTSAALRALQTDDSAATAAVALLAAVYPQEPTVSANFGVCRTLTPHVRALWDSGGAPRTAATDWLLNQAGNFLRTIGDIQGSLALAEASFAITTELLPESDREYAAGLHNLATARMEVGDLEGAERDMARAVGLQEQHLPDSATLATSYDVHGYVLHEMAAAGQADRLVPAIRRRQQALALNRRLHGRSSEPVARSLNNLGATRRLQGRNAAAARLAAAALGIIRQVVAPDDTRLAASAMNVGSNWLEAGRADKAEPLLQEALDICAPPSAQSRITQTCAPWQTG